MGRCLSVWCVWGALLTSCLEVGAVERHRVLGPEFPGRYKHPSSIEEFDNGDLFIAYYGGEGEYAEDTAVYGMRKKKGEDKWSTPRIIADTPDRSEGNAVVWQAPDGIVWLFYVCRYGETWSTSRIKCKLSKDRGVTWSDSRIIAFEQGMMVRNRPIVLSNGDYLLPVYHEKGEDREQVEPESASRFLRLKKGDHEWSDSGMIVSVKGNIQPGVAEISPDRLVAYCRRGGGYEPTETGYIVRSESNDGGHTWSEGQDSEFPNPNSAVDFLKLQSGNLLLVYNNSMNSRTPLSAALSTDQDKSYPHRIDLVTGEGPYAYPFVIQSRDGTIHAVFTSDARTVINHLTFREAELLDK
ncbi:MAG: sialidase family protein [Pirellulaceae bacterium]